MIIKAKNGETILRFAEELAIDVCGYQLEIMPVYGQFENLEKAVVALKIRKRNDFTSDETIIVSPYASNQIEVR